jgi:hypothetical protein
MDYTGFCLMLDCVWNYYQLSIGRPFPLARCCPTSPQNQGLFASLEQTPGMCGLSLDQITDGTSTTIFCAEMAGRPDYWTRAGKSASSVNPNGGGAWASQQTTSFILGSSFTGSGPRTCFRAKCPKPICFFNCTNETYLNAIFSFHPGAGGVALCDGSARMLSENLSIVTFHALFTPRGHEPAPDNF